ncbi:MAG: hypothetical protein E4G91_05715 [Candidatus Zixiibacteriota bacterium]|nr:MAG: hypothetical protein E4G91_05715 [candidate division Zixibacteria bacterium]
MMPADLMSKKFMVLASPMERPEHLIRAALRAVDWKTEHGLAVQIGLEGAVDELNKIAAWLSEHRDENFTVIDDLENKRSSLLDSLKAESGAHYHTTPTMNGRVRLYREAPVFHFPILFLHVATMNRTEIVPVAKHIRAGTVLYGAAIACALVCEVAECEAQPLYFHGDKIAVRIA